MASNRIRLIIIVLCLIVLITLPLWASRYIVSVLLLIYLYMTVASMWNLLAGYSGLISLGQQMFIGIGGYTLAVLSIYYGIVKEVD